MEEHPSRDPEMEEKESLINSTGVGDNPGKNDDLEDLPKWINNDGVEVEEVFGFNENAELVNGRAAMVGFLMLLITELLFNGLPVTHSIFGIN